MPFPCYLLLCIGLPVVEDRPAEFGQQPHTIHIDYDNWGNRSWGFHAIFGSQASIKLAFSSNGFRSSYIEFRNYRLGFFSHARGPFRVLCLRPQDVGYVVNEEERTITTHPCHLLWTEVRDDLADSSCAKMAAELFPEVIPIRPGARVAGQEVVRFRGKGSDNSVTEVALAPHLRCEPMEYDRRWPGTLGIPGAREHWLVTSYTLGEPDANQFQLPAGYRLQK